MLLIDLDRRVATLIRLIGLGLITWSVSSARHAPGTAGRPLVVTVLLAAAGVSWLVWTAGPVARRRLTPDLYVMAAAGGLLVGASPDSAASAFVFVAVVSAAARGELAQALPAWLVGALAIAVSALVYDQSALGVLAYDLGLAAAALAASNSRQRVVRAEQAELLLAQTQRSHEEQLRAARLEESTRLAREIHDVLAHALAGLTIQLEATGALVEQGADREVVLSRVRHAHELAREGLRETRRAVGALRGEPVAAPARIQTLVQEYRAADDAPAELTIDGSPQRLAGATGETVVRVVQEALTNVRKHAPGARVAVAVHAGAAPGDGVTVVVDDHETGGARTAGGEAAAGAGSCGLAGTGGGFGLRGMRERAQLLGGTLDAGPTRDGWRVELRLPAPAASNGSGA